MRFLKLEFNTIADFEYHIIISQTSDFTDDATGRNDFIALTQTTNQRFMFLGSFCLRTP